MTSPVRCGHCGGIYDLGTVTVTARYTDCSVWRAPCCDREVDDRPPGWGGPVRAYEHVGHDEVDQGVVFIDPYGRFVRGGAR